MVVKRKFQNCEAAGRSNNTVPEQPRELSLTNDVPTYKKTHVDDAIVPLHSKTDGGGGMEENIGERNPPTLVGRSEMPIDHEAGVNNASAASSGNNFLAMTMDSCILNTPLSRPVEFESPLAIMSNNNTSQSSLGLQVQDMLKNRPPNNSSSSDSMLTPPNSILEKSKTGPIGVSPLMGLAEQKNSTATDQHSRYTGTHLGSQLSSVENQTTSVVGITCIQPNTALQSQRCTPYPLNPPNLLSSQTFYWENQSNFLKGGSSSYWLWDKPAIGPGKIEPTLGALQSYYGSGGNNHSRITPGGQAMVGWNQNYYNSNAHPLVGFRQNQMS